jgi:hypothetical protein
MRVRRFAGLLKNFPSCGGGLPGAPDVSGMEVGWRFVGTEAFRGSVVMIGPGPGLASEGTKLGLSLARTVFRPSRVGSASMLSGLSAEGSLGLDSDIERSTDGTDCGEGVFSDEVEPYESVTVSPSSPNESLPYSSTKQSMRNSRSIKSSFPGFHPVYWLSQRMRAAFRTPISRFPVVQLNHR